jgi:hypothetical protein
MPAGQLARVPTFKLAHYCVATPMRTSAMIGVGRISALTTARRMTVGLAVGPDLAPALRLGDIGRFPRTRQGHLGASPWLFPALLFRHDLWL